MCYSLWYNAPTMLPVGSLEAELPGYQPAASWVHYTTSCNTHSSAPEVGRDQRPKHAELIGIINKPLLLHLVGVYISFIAMMHGQTNIKLNVWSVALLEFGCSARLEFPGL